MSEYQVTWTIDIEADNPREAALQALEIQRDPASMAKTFNVYTSDLDRLHGHIRVEL